MVRRRMPTARYDGTSLSPEELSKLSLEDLSEQVAVLSLQREAAERMHEKIKAGEWDEEDSGGEWETASEDDDKVEEDAEVDVAVARSRRMMKLRRAMRTRREVARQTAEATSALRESMSGEAGKRLSQRLSFFADQHWLEQLTSERLREERDQARLDRDEALAERDSIATAGLEFDHSMRETNKQLEEAMLQEAMLTRRMLTNNSTLLRHLRRARAERDAARASAPVAGVPLTVPGTPLVEALLNTAHAVEQLSQDVSPALLRTLRTLREQIINPAWPPPAP